MSSDMVSAAAIGIALLSLALHAVFWLHLRGAQVGSCVECHKPVRGEDAYLIEPDGHVTHGACIPDRTGRSIRWEVSGDQ
jgi:hypothetical protein